MNGLAALLLLVQAAAQQGLQVLHDAHCVEARASFLGAHLQETNGTARVALDLQLTALSTCDKHTKVLVDASAEDALADGDDGLEVCVLWVSMTGAERRTSRCYGGGQPARVEWDLTAALRQRYRLVAWPARGAWPGAFAGASHTLSFEADLGAAAFPPPHLLFTSHEHGATLAGRARRACDGSPLHLYAGTQHRDTDENWYHFTFGMLLPLAARLSERDDACAAVGRRPPPTVLYVRRCGFRRALVEAVGTDDFRLVDLSGKPPPQNVSLEVLPRMDYWSDQAHALLELLARGARGRAWLLERFAEATTGAACVFQTRAARPGRRPFAIANFEALAEAYSAKSRCETRVAPDPTGLTLAEQIQAHADASLLVAPHGVALCRNQIVAARILIYAQAPASRTRPGSPRAPASSRSCQSLSAPTASSAASPRRSGSGRRASTWTTTKAEKSRSRRSSAPSRPARRRRSRNGSGPPTRTRTTSGGSWCPTM